MPSTLPRPPYDVELGAVLATIRLPHTITTAHIKPMREGMSGASPDPSNFNEHFSHEEVTIPGPAGNLVLSVFENGLRPSRRV